MTQQITTLPSALRSMQNVPQCLYYRGNIELLKQKKVSIVGSRKALPYSKEITAQIATKLSRNAIAIVSGGADGIDSAAHRFIDPSMAIAVVANGLDIHYPKCNSALFSQIERKGLMLSQFKEGTKAARWSFVVRNEIVVALGDVLIVAEAEVGSGTMHSINYALKMKKPIYVLPHRLGQSSATHQLVAQKKAIVIEDVDSFVESMGVAVSKSDSALESFVSGGADLEEVLKRFGDELFEAELEGRVIIKDARVFRV